VLVFTRLLEISMASDTHLWFMKEGHIERDRGIIDIDVNTIIISEILVAVHTPLVGAFRWKEIGNSSRAVQQRNRRNWQQSRVLCAYLSFAIFSRQGRTKVLAAGSLMESEAQ
jgi:hypothetical protein